MKLSLPVIIVSTSMVLFTATLATSQTTDDEMFDLWLESNSPIRDYAGESLAIPIDGSARSIAGSSLERSAATNPSLNWDTGCDWCQKNYHPQVLEPSGHIHHHR